jgi:hypothetical protein
MMVVPPAAADKLAAAGSAKPSGHGRARSPLPFETIFAEFAGPTSPGGCRRSLDDSEPAAAPPRGADLVHSLKPPPSPTQMPHAPEARGLMSCPGGFLYERLWKLGLVAESYEGVSDCSTADAVDRHSLAPSSAPLTPSQAPRAPEASACAEAGVTALATISSMDLPVLLGADCCQSAAMASTPKSLEAKAPRRPEAPPRPSQRLREPAAAPRSPATSPACDADPPWLAALRSAPSAGAGAILGDSPLDRRR